MPVTVVEAARLLWCPGLSNLTGDHKSTIHTWLATATYAPTATEKSIRLIGIDRQNFLEALGSDINRIATAASETLLNIVEVDGLPNSLAWPYVKLYYSALFYAHSLLRVWGRSPSYFRILELAQLRSLLTAYSVKSPYKLQTGQYILIADGDPSSVELQIDDSGGGSHESVWRGLIKALTDLQYAVANSPYRSVDKMIVDADLKLILSLVSNNGKNYAWPSHMRNEIQYKQSEGVWYPYRGRAKSTTLQQEVLAILRGTTDLSKIISAAGSDLELFRSACTATICLVRGVIADMSAVGGSKHFLRHGQRKFEQSIADRISGRLKVKY
jgi:hypothetical protein